MRASIPPQTGHKSRLVTIEARMRIPYPERIPLVGAASFAGLLVVAQLLRHTDPVFSALCFVFIMLATIGFNLAGGLYTPAGAYIFFNAVLTLIVGLIVKVFVNEPADSNLTFPILTIAVYTLGMLAMLSAAYVENRLRPQRPLIVKLFPLAGLRNVYVGSVILGIALKAYWLTDPLISPGSPLLALRNNDSLLPFALILGVIYTVVSTNGKRSLTPGLAILFFVTTALGLLTFSKQVFFTPVFCWVLGAAVSRYRLKPMNFVVIPVIFVLGFYYGTPVEQVGKGMERTGSIVKDVGVGIDLILHINRTRALYEADSVSGYGIASYYNQPEGLFDRLEMVSMDALLIAQTEREGPFGLKPVIEGWENLVPHFFWPGKPIPYYGNVYGHQIGILSLDDFTTSVSFSATADAYHEAEWVGVLVVESLCFAIVFVVISWAVGSVRDHPAVLLLIVTLAHSAPEAGMTGTILLISLTLVVFGIAFACRYILPVVASAFQPASLPIPYITASAVD